IYHVSLRYGFHDSINIPESLRAVHKNHPVFKVDLSDASYFISLSRVIPSKRHNLMRWRKTLYCLMSRNAISTSDYYRLPVGRTLEMRTLINL
ncbi:MAG: potassium transporter Kup, partial [Candidatus Saccharimonadales bacterium]